MNKIIILYFKLLLFFMIFFVINGKVSKKIQGGTDLSTNSVNYQVSIQINNQHLCSGLVINEYYVLTAVTCIVLEENIILGNIKIRAGSNDLLDNESTFLSYHNVSLVIIHPNFNIRNFWSNDICLLKISTELRFNTYYIRFGELTKSRDIKTVLQVSGWSTDLIYSSTSISTQPLKKMNIERPTNCYSIFGRNLYLTQSCAYGNPRSFHLTLGDGGGPIFFYRKICGLVSVISSYEHSPFIYTKTIYYNDWINDMLHNY